MRAFGNNKKRIASGVDKWKGSISNIQSRENRDPYSSNTQEYDNKILKKHLYHFFKEGKTIDDYLEYLEKDYLIWIYEETKFLSGEEVKVTKEHPERWARLERLATSVKIELCDYNKDVNHF